MQRKNMNMTKCYQCAYLFQGNCQTSNCVVVWATLKSRKDSLIDFVFVVVQHLEESIESISEIHTRGRMADTSN